MIFKFSLLVFPGLGKDGKNFRIITAHNSAFFLLNSSGYDRLKRISNFSQELLFDFKECETPIVCEIRAALKGENVCARHIREMNVLYYTNEYMLR